jgi:hypothetical protein
MFAELSQRHILKVIYFKNKIISHVLNQWVECDFRWDCESDTLAQFKVSVSLVHCVGLALRSGTHNQLVPNELNWDITSK